jgi:HEAT repeat protein
MEDPAEIPLDELIAALLDADTPLNHRFLYRLSDLDAEELSTFKETWPKMPSSRRQALMEDLEQLGMADDLLSYEAISRYTMNDEDPRVRLSAIRILWEYDTEDLIPAYLRILETDPEDPVRAAAAASLGLFVYKGELEELPADILQDLQDRLFRIFSTNTDAQVRQRILESLSYSSRDELPPLIEKAFSSGDKDWMATALIAMGRSVDKRWQEDVLSMLDSKVPVLRAEAARAAGELELAESVTNLVDLAEDADDDVRLAAIWSLSQIGGEKARRTLEGLLREHRDDEEADFLETALDNLSFTDGLQPFSILDFPENQAEDDLYDLLMDMDEEDFSDFEDEDGEFLAYEEEDTFDFHDIEDFIDEDEDLAD